MPARPLSGVIPVLPTPFRENGEVDPESLVRVAEYCVDRGAAGLLYPANASEVQALTVDERIRLCSVLASAVGRAVPILIGVSSDSPTTSRRLVEVAESWAADAILVMPPAGSPETVAAYLRAVLQDTHLRVVVQNAGPPAGPSLPVETLLAVLGEFPNVEYVKEESAPTGPRISRLLASKPAHVVGCFGGDGGRSVLNELRRGAIGFMPAADLVADYVLLYAQFTAGDLDAAYRTFVRILPYLNLQRVYRWSATKRVLERMGLIESPMVRMDLGGSHRTSPLDPVDEDELARFVDGSEAAQGERARRASPGAASDTQ